MTSSAARPRSTMPKRAAWSPSGSIWRPRSSSARIEPRTGLRRLRIALAREKLQQIGHAAPGIAVADIVSGGIVIDKFGTLDALAHFLVRARMADRLLPRRDDESRAVNAGQLVHEVVSAHVQNEAGHETRVVRARLVQ